MLTNGSTYIIAEAGVNHNGDMSLARKLIDVAAAAGANAVKFQSFRAGQMVSRHAPKAEYQTRTTDTNESQFEMIRRLELTEADHEFLIAHASARGIEFLSSPFDAQSLRLLTERFGLRTIKIPSGEITNAPFLLAIAQAAERVILSTGMSTLAEVEAALGVLAFGFNERDRAPTSQSDFVGAFTSENGQRALRERVMLLHCTSEYPSPAKEVNLRVMDTLFAAFRLPVGYSDHTEGIHVSLAAVARGARLIEKHFTLDRNMPGPDHTASITPGELEELVRQTREIEQSLGDGIKRPSDSEWKNRDVARKSLVAASEIHLGESFTDANLASKRPGNGISPMFYWDYLGRSASRPYDRDDLIQ